MHTYEITAPNGKTYRIDGPAGASDAQVRAEVLRQFPEAFGRARAKPAPKRSLLTDIMDSTVNDFAGVAQGAASLVDLPAMLVEAGSQALDYGIDKGLRAVGAGKAADALAERQRKFAPYRAPVGISGAIEKAFPTKPGYETSRFISQLAGGLMVPGPKFASPAPKGNAFMPNAVAKAAERQGVRVLPADVGGATTRRLTAGVAQTPFGAAPVVNAARQSVDDMAAAVGRVAQKAGRVLDAEDAGTLVQKGVKGFVKKTSRIGGRLYDRAETLAGNAKVDPANARAALDDVISGLSETPETNAAALKLLTGLRDDLATPMSVQAARKLRTNVRTAIMKEGLRGSDLERMVGEVLDNVSADIATSVPPRAAAAYKTADAFWKQRVDQIDEILAPVVGKRGEKDATASFAAIERIARTGDAKRLSRLMASLPKDDAGAITATMIDRLGAATPGAQNATGSAFSPATFLTNWNKMSGKAKAVLFDADLRTALDDLATVAGGMKEASKYANVSQTGGANNVASILTGGGGAVTGSFLAGPVGAVVGFIGPIAGQIGLGKLMASPGFARWLAGTARASKSLGAKAAVQRQLPKLAAVASQNPAVASEVTALERALLNALNDNAAVGGAAANDLQEGSERQ